MNDPFVGLDEELDALLNELRASEDDKTAESRSENEEDKFASFDDGIAVEDISIPTAVEELSMPTAVEELSIPTSVEEFLMPTAVEELTEDKELIMSAVADSITVSKPLPSAFTVFIIQSHLLYKSTESLIERIYKIVDENPNVLFVFSDVANIPDGYQKNIFNNNISHAFLLDDIIRFIRDRGQNSVFGLQDQQELKENFGKSIKYDGYYFDTANDNICKLKLIKGV